MSTITRRWFAFVQLDDRSGASSALSGVFAQRGVSFRSISTLDVHGGTGTVCVQFAASDRLARVLVRTVERLAVTRAVDLVSGDDARVRAVAVLQGSLGGLPVPGGVDVLASGGTTVLSGPLTAIMSVVADVRAAGGAPLAVTVLPPA